MRYRCEILNHGIDGYEVWLHGRNQGRSGVKTSISITIIDNIYTNYSYMYAKCSCGILCTDISEKFSVLYVTDCTKVSDTPEKYYNEEIH